MKSLVSLTLILGLGSWLVPVALAQTSHLTVNVLPLIYDPKVPQAAAYGAAFDVVLASRLADRGTVTARTVNQNDLPLSYKSIVFTNNQANIGYLIRRLAADQAGYGRFFLVSLMTKPFDNAIGLYSWLIDAIDGVVIVKAYSSGPFDFSAATRATEIAQQLLDGIEKITTGRLEAGFISASGQTVDGFWLKSALNNLTVTLPNGQAVGTIKDGQLRFDYRVLVGSDIILVLSKNGYYPATKSFRITRQTKEIDVGDLYPKRPYRLGLYWPLNLITAGGLSFTNFLFDDEYVMWEVGAGLYVLSSRLYAGGQNLAANSFFPELYATFGSYLFFSPTLPFRLYLKTGLGWVAGIPSGENRRLRNDIFLKPILLGIELNLLPVTVGLEIYYRYYLEIFDSRLFSLGVIGNSPRIDITARVKF